VPCTRCQRENNVCCYGERKESVERRIPPGYVEYLERQQEVLVEALKKAWSKHIRPGHQSPNEQDPSVCNILEQLHISVDVRCPHRYSSKFEEDVEKVRSELAANATLNSECISPTKWNTDSALQTPDLVSGLSSMGSATSDSTIRNPFEMTQTESLMADWSAPAPAPAPLESDTLNDSAMGFAFNDPTFAFNSVSLIPLY